MSEKSCADRIKDELQKRNELLEEIYEKIESEDDEEREEALEELYNLPLSIDKFEIIKIALSTGGPGDWIEVMVDEQGYIHKMTYHFQDWFDHASISLDKYCYMWQYASEVVDSL